MEQRRLGRTDHMSTVMIMGTAAFWEIDQEGASQALDLVAEAGVNHIDVAPQYGNAEDVLGPWLEPRRERFFVGCKTLERRRDPATIELNRSLTKLRTDYLDLYQMHALTRLEELDEAMGPGGVLETMIAAQAQGKVRFLGLTTHGMFAPLIVRQALERYDLDTVMFPLNPRLYADDEYRHNAQAALELCQQRAVGVMIIKALAKGPWGDRPKAYQSWYEPFDTYEAIQPSVDFALSQPGVTAIVSAGDVRLLPDIIKAADNHRPMGESDQAALIAQRASDEPIFVREETISP